MTVSVQIVEDYLGTVGAIYFKRVGWFLLTDTQRQKDIDNQGDNVNRKLHCLNLRREPFGPLTDLC